MKKAFGLIILSLILIFTGYGKNVSDQSTLVIDDDMTGRVEEVAGNSSELKWVSCQRILYVNQGGDDNSPNGYVGFMIDFENQKYYLCKMYGENEFPHDYSLGEEIDLTDDQMIQI